MANQIKSIPNAPTTRPFICPPTNNQSCDHAFAQFAVASAPPDGIWVIYWMPIMEEIFSNAHKAAVERVTKRLMSPGVYIPPITINPLVDGLLRDYLRVHLAEHHIREPMITEEMARFMGMPVGEFLDDDDDDHERVVSISQNCLLVDFTVPTWNFLLGVVFACNGETAICGSGSGEVIILEMFTAEPLQSLTHGDYLVQIVATCH
ncbi:hypothetical protein DFJ58DRAFT_839167 [Suillus subalutaceus]|uniref:uncharacterized protein n=1 Tax=Suillus subalutaceus TaxID=48586 RepID=UPI001B886405|nr:uncharacterized protein DFJ58DRAFT_842356 [Suillus subalutaceus]XP_041246651.1 uncharacterized protein DFJ58DRAFT_839167 [Suillus subalutaceus]KAG1850861.1 hypothetical protein DFJ58DRAFT_842356 [Suillus subalutaceus]KAG1863184.1 hypothetical protein DFJ58DRAFT_839167 [Suillus subalutaceus]